MEHDRRNVKLLSRRLSERSGFFLNLLKDSTWEKGKYESPSSPILPTLSLSTFTLWLLYTISSTVWYTCWPFNLTAFRWTLAQQQVNFFLKPILSSFSIGPRLLAKEFFQRSLEYFWLRHRGRQYNRCTRRWVWGKYLIDFLSMTMSRLDLTMLSIGKLHQRRFPSTVSSGSSHQTSSPGLHYPYSFMDVCTVI